MLMFRRQVYLGSKAFRLEAARRDEVHAKHMAYDAARQELYERILQEKREEAEEYAAVHVGYLVSGPKMCAPIWRPFATYYGLCIIPEIMYSYHTLIFFSCHNCQNFSCHDVFVFP